MELRRGKHNILLTLLIGITLMIGNSIATAEDSDKETEPENQSRPPGSFDIDEEAATRALERSLIQINALLLPPGRLELALNLGFNSDASNTPVIVTLIDPDDANQTINTLGITQLENRNYDAAVNASIGLPRDTQLSFNLPFVSRNLFNSTSLDGSIAESDNASINGIGDVGLSLLKTLAKEKGRRPDVIARLTVDLDTGDDNQSGLRTGSNAVEYTFGLGATKRQDPLVFSYQLLHTVSEETGDFESGDVTQLSLGAILAASPYTSIKLSFSQSIIGKSRFDGVDIEQANRAPATISLGTSSVVGRSLFLFSDVTVGLNDSATDYRISLGISKQISIF